MILSILMAIALLFAQTPQVTDEDDVNVFLDLGREHCATEIVFAAYEQTAQDEIVTTAMPAYITYSAFQFETAAEADAALNDSPGLVAETFSDNPNISEDPDFDQLVTEVETREYGDDSAAYVMTLPVDDEELDVLTIEMLGVVEGAQLLLLLMFSETGTNRPGVGLTIETVPPFVGDLDDQWEGTGDLEEAVPAQDEMPLGWEGEKVILEDPPNC